MARVLIIGDTHAPGMRRGYVDFLKRIADDYSVNRVVHIGDLVDWASISFHEKSPALSNAVREFDVARRQVASPARAFPNADWMIGNHDALSERQAISVGLPPQLLRDYADVWEVDWTVHPRFSKLTIDGVLYSHGDSGRGGQDAAFKQAKDNFRSTVIGHFHSQDGVKWWANPEFRVFGMSVGCGIDVSRLAQTCAEGAVRHGERNWELGMPASALINHGLRHLNLWMEGDDDEAHLAHAAWNLFALMHFEETRPDLIDIPTRPEACSPTAVGRCVSIWRITDVVVTPRHPLLAASGTHWRHSLLLVIARDESRSESVRCCALCKSSSFCEHHFNPATHLRDWIGNRSRSFAPAHSPSVKHATSTKLLLAMLVGQQSTGAVCRPARLRSHQPYRQPWPSRRSSS